MMNQLNVERIRKRNQRKTDVLNSLAGEPLALCRFLDRLSHGGMLNVDVDVEGHVLAVAIGDDPPTPIYFGTLTGIIWTFISEAAQLSLEMYTIPRIKLYKVYKKKRSYPDTIAVFSFLCPALLSIGTLPTMLIALPSIFE
jgi:hypothetical protein